MCFLFCFLLSLFCDAFFFFFFILSLSSFFLLHSPCIGLTLCCRLESNVVRLYDLRRNDTFLRDLHPPSLHNFHLGYSSSSLSTHLSPRRFLYFSAEDAGTALHREVVTLSAMAFRRRPLQEREDRERNRIVCGEGRIEKEARRKEREEIHTRERKLQESIMASRGVLATKSFLLSIHREEKRNRKNEDKNCGVDGAIHQW